MLGGTSSAGIRSGGALAPWVFPNGPLAPNRQSSICYDSCPFGLQLVNSRYHSLAVAHVGPVRRIEAPLVLVGSYNRRAIFWMFRRPGKPRSRGNGGRRKIEFEVSLIRSLTLSSMRRSSSIGGLHQSVSILRGETALPWVHGAPGFVAFGHCRTSVGRCLTRGELGRHLCKIKATWHSRKFTTRQVLIYGDSGRVFSGLGAG